MNALFSVAKKFLISAFPVSVFVPMLKTAPGAQRVIIRSTLCVDAACAGLLDLIDLVERASFFVV